MNTKFRYKLARAFNWRSKLVIMLELKEIYNGQVQTKREINQQIRRRP